MAGDLYLKALESERKQCGRPAASKGLAKGTPSGCGIVELDNAIAAHKGRRRAERPGSGRAACAPSGRASLRGGRGRISAHTVPGGLATWKRSDG